MKYAFLALSYWTLGYLLPTLPVSLRWPLAILVILLSFVVLVYRVDTHLPELSFTRGVSIRFYLRHKEKNLAVILHEPLHEPGEWGLWHITESEAWLRDELQPTPTETEALGQIRGAGRRREYLAARLLLHAMSGRPDRGALIKDEDGKPHLRDSIFHVSISHTINYAAAIAHPDPCGIDVQRIVPRIRSLARKFVSEGERIQLRTEHELLQLHLIWSAKEAMYKAFGRRRLDFKRHLYVDFEGFTPEKGTASALLKRDTVEMLFSLNFRIYDGFVLVACVEKTEPLP